MAGQLGGGYRPPPGGTWEYKTIVLASNLPTRIDAACNAMGEQGWELVSVDDEAGKYTFKRRTS